MSASPWVLENRPPQDVDVPRSRTSNYFSKTNVLGRPCLRHGPRPWCPNDCSTFCKENKYYVWLLRIPFILHASRSNCIYSGAVKCNHKCSPAKFMKSEPIWTNIFELERKQTVCQEIDLTSGCLVLALSLMKKLKLIFWDYIRPIIFCENPKSNWWNTKEETL